MSDPQPDLFASPEDAIPPGTIEGPPGWAEGFGAGLRVWCGPVAGWRPFGELINPGRTVIPHQFGRLSAGLVFDLGAHVVPRPRATGEEC